MLPAGGGEGRVITEDSYTHILTYTHTHTTKIYKLIHSLTLHCGAFNPLNNGDTNQLKTHEYRTNARKYKSLVGVRR